MKKMKTILIILAPILLFSCGFKPINEKGKNLVYLQDVKIEGEQRLSYTLRNNILLVSDKNSTNRYDAKIKLDKQKNTKIKNKAGRVTRYNITIYTSLVLTDLDNKNNIEKTFIQGADYDVAKVHSDTINNENKAIKSIVQQLSDDIINFISLSARKK
jgi:hypothetical protein